MSKEPKPNPIRYEGQRLVVAFEEPVLVTVFQQAMMNLTFHRFREQLRKYRDRVPRMRPGRWEQEKYDLPPILAILTKP